jgi:hypothetical protein
VTYTAFDDSWSEGGTQPTSIVHTLQSTDLAYDSVGMCVEYNADTGACSTRVANPGATVAVNITDNDVNALTVTPASGTVSVNESTASVADTFTLALSSAPLGSVTVTFGINAVDIAVSPSAVTFTAVNYNAPVTVSVFAANNFIAQAKPYTVAITAAAAGVYADYTMSAATIVTATVADDDYLGILTSVSSQSIGEQESNGFSYTVVLRYAHYHASVG